MLSDRARVILFWFTIGMIGLVALVAIITILRACSGVVSIAPRASIRPAEVSLCPGEQQQFTVEDDAEVTWEAAGGTISPSGLFTAGATASDYTVEASRPGSRLAAEAIVHVVACTPTATPIPSPTLLPTPTTTPTLEPTAPLPSADPQGDLEAYESGSRIETSSPGLDIRAASIGPDMRVELQPTTGVPAQLAGWATPDEVLLWVALYEPIPNPPSVFTDWLFVLDLDGNVATGRPAGSARINPDLGTEAAVGVSYNPASGQFEPYLWIWDPAQQNWAERPNVVRFYLDESRTLIGLALPRETLVQDVTQTTGVTLVPEAVKGRTAALSYTGEQPVVDFYPNRPAQP